MSGRDLRREYEICQDRGHDYHTSYRAGSGPDVNVCLWCGTHYWTETIKHEDHVPPPSVSMTKRQKEESDMALWVRKTKRKL